MLPSPARTRTWHAQKQCRLRQGRAGDDEGLGEKGEVGRGGGVEGGERGRGRRGSGEEGEKGRGPCMFPFPRLHSFLSPLVPFLLSPRCQRPAPARPPCQPHIGVFWARVHAGNSKAVSTKPVRRAHRQEKNEIKIMRARTTLQIEISN